MVLALAVERSFEVDALRSEKCGVLVLDPESPFEVDAFGWEKCGVLALVVERPFELDAVLGANVELTPDEPFPPAALLVLLGKLVGFESPGKGT